MKFFGLDLEKTPTVPDWFFPCLVQMITTMRECVAYNDLWPWPISSRSFGLGRENRVRSVGSTVLDGFFPYLVQMINSIRGCVPCDDPWPWLISSRSLRLDLENRVCLYLAQRFFSESENLNCWQIFEIFWPWPWKKIYSSQWILSIFSTNDH